MSQQTRADAPSRRAPSRAWHRSRTVRVPVRRGPAVRRPLLITVTDAAQRLARHEQTIRAMIRRRELAAVRLGRFVRVLAAAVEARRADGGPAHATARRPRGGRAGAAVQAASRI